MVPLKGDKNALNRVWHKTRVSKTAAAKTKPTNLLPSVSLELLVIST